MSRDHDVREKRKRGKRRAKRLKERAKQKKV